MRISGLNNQYLPQNNSGKNHFYSPSFKSEFVVDASSAISRSQVLTLGMLMNNFWIRRPRQIFDEIKYQGVFGNFTMPVNDYRDDVVEKILKNNNIRYTKIKPEEQGMMNMYNATVPYNFSTSA